MCSRSIPLLALSLVLSASVAPAKDTAFVLHQAEAVNPSAAYRWLDVVQEASPREVERDGARPTILSRYMAIAVTAMYDAWAPYDAKAVGTRLGGALRRPAAERTDANKAKAIAYGAYRALLFVHPEDAAWIRGEMGWLGYDPDDASTDPATPQGIGNLTARAILDFRANDGSNQFGTLPGSQTKKPFSDYTGYVPMNPGDEIRDPDRWQPIPFSDGQGSTVRPGFLTPHWHLVKPLVLERADAFRPPPPPRVGDPKLQAEVDEVIAFNAGLSMENRALVEFMRDGPRSTGQSGHWLRFAQDVSRRDRQGIDEDVKLFFAVGGVVFDAFIACWEAKRFYDSSRPWTLVRHYYAGRTIRGWRGPGKGVSTELPAEKWHPYSPDTFVTPPFPGYPSGHSTASAAAATILTRLTGSPRLGVLCQHRAGSLTGEGSFAPGVVLSTDGKPPRNAPRSNEITLECPTFWSTAEMAGLSRILGGYHIRADNDAGLELGRKVAEDSWPKYRAYFEGTAPAPK